MLSEMLVDLDCDAVESSEHSSGRAVIIARACKKLMLANLFAKPD